MNSKSIIVSVLVALLAVALFTLVLDYSEGDATEVTSIDLNNFRYDVIGNNEVCLIGYYGESQLSSIDLRDISVDGRTYYLTEIGDDTKPLDGSDKMAGELTIEGSVRFVYRHAFQNSDITSIHWNTEIVRKVIDDEAFRNCDKLTKVDIKNYSGSVGSNTFADCDNLSTVEITGTVSLANGDFENCLNLKTVKLGKFNRDTLAYNMFFNCKSLEIIECEESSITEVEKYCFDGCEVLTSVPLGLLESVGEYAFRNCKVLNPDDLDLSNAESIGKHAFENTPLKKVSISILTKIEEATFKGCTKLVSAELANTTSIGEEAFNSCVELKSISSNKVETVEKAAFQKCGKLEEFVTSKIISVGNSAFDECVSLKKFECKDATKIENAAFYKCELLKSFNAPGITSIGTNAFKFSGLESFTANECKNVDTGAFEQCESLVEVHFNKAERLEQLVFEGCIKLKVLEMRSATGTYPNSIVGCDALTDVILPSLKSVPNDFFSDKHQLKTINLASWENVPDYFFSGMTNLIVLDLSSAKSIGERAFNGCKALDSLVCDSCTALGKEAFLGCESLKSVSMVSLTDVKEKTFYECKGLLEIKLGKVENISEYAFYRCESLKGHIDFANAKNIGECAFRYCTNFGSSVVSYYLESIGRYAFDNCEHLTEKGLVLIPKSLKCVSEHAFSGCSMIQYLLIESPDVIIENHAFSQCKSISGHLYLEGVKSVGDYAFSYCENITGLTIGANVKTIGRSAFESCSLITNITVLGDLESVGIDAFRNCVGMDCKVVTFHCDPPSFGVGSMSMGNEEKPVIFLLDTPGFEWDKDIFDKTILGDSTEVEFTRGVCGESLSYHFNPENFSVVITGNGAMTDYENIDDRPWNRYTQLINAVYLSSGVIHIGKNAFASCINLVEIKFPYFANGSLDIGENGFSDCVRLKDISLSALGDIGPGAFKNCSMMKGEFSLSSATKIIGANAFMGCTGITSLNLMNVSEIGDGAFSGCTGLCNDLSIPKTVVSIGEYAFYRCSGLDGKSILFYGDEPYLGDSSFMLGNRIVSETFVTIKTNGWGNDTVFSERVLGLYTFASFELFTEDEKQGFVLNPIVVWLVATSLGLVGALIVYRYYRRDTL